MSFYGRKTHGEGETSSLDRRVTEEDEDDLERSRYKGQRAARKTEGADDRNIQERFYGGRLGSCTLDGRVELGRGKIGIATFTGQCLQHICQ